LSAFERTLIWLYRIVSYRKMQRRKTAQQNETQLAQNGDDGVITG